MRANRLVAEICRNEFHSLLQGYFYRRWLFRKVKSVGFGHGMDDQQWDELDGQYRVNWSEYLQARRLEDRWRRDNADRLSWDVPLDQVQRGNIIMDLPGLADSTDVSDWFKEVVFMNAEKLDEFITGLIERVKGKGSEKDEAIEIWKRMQQEFGDQNLVEGNPYYPEHGKVLSRVLGGGRRSGKDAIGAGGSQILEYLKPHANEKSCQGRVPMENDTFRFADITIFDELIGGAEGQQFPWARKLLLPVKALDPSEHGGMRQFAWCEDIKGETSKQFALGLYSGHPGHALERNVRKAEDLYTVDYLMGVEPHLLTFTDPNHLYWPKYWDIERQRKSRAAPVRSKMIGPAEEYKQDDSGEGAPLVEGGVFSPPTTRQTPISGPKDSVAESMTTWILITCAALGLYVITTR